MKIFFFFFNFSRKTWLEHRAKYGTLLQSPSDFIIPFHSCPGYGRCAHAKYSFVDLLPFFNMPLQEGEREWERVSERETFHPRNFKVAAPGNLVNKGHLWPVWTREGIPSLYLGVSYIQILSHQIYNTCSLAEYTGSYCGINYRSAKHEAAGIR